MAKKKCEKDGDKPVVTGKDYSCSKCSRVSNSKEKLCKPAKVKHEK
jgi:hypothetical protein